MAAPHGIYSPAVSFAISSKLWQGKEDVEQTKENRQSGNGSVYDRSWNAMSWKSQDRRLLFASEGAQECRSPIPHR